MPPAIRDKYQYFTEAKMDRLRAAGYPGQMTPLEDGMREAHAWYVQQPPLARDYAWEDALLKANAT